MKKELKDPELLQFYLEGADRSWLKKEAHKRKWSVAKILRHLISYLKHNKHIIK